MDAFIIEGGKSLSGSVAISGSKNTALPLLFASILFDDPVKFSNVPRLWDVETTLKLLESMGAQYDWNKESGDLTVLPRISLRVAPYDWVKKMRAGILALGPLVGKYGEAKVSLPGGCAIGARPVNYHLEALRQMGVRIEVEQGYVNAQVLGGLKGATIEFPQVTVTGTENILMAAIFAKGKTILKNAAREPEVVALGNVLVACGAKIVGLGTDEIHIEESPLKAPSTPIRVPADRIETGTWIAIAAATKSELRLTNCDARDLTSVMRVFREMGIAVEESANGSVLTVKPSKEYRSVSVTTEPFPGFPTDMQAQLMAVACLAQGKTRIEEMIFENRFMHVGELQRLGASIQIDGSIAEVNGPAVLKGAPIMATDLRASASLVVAALAASGSTKISRIYHLDRGYQKLDQKLEAVGARVTRIEE